MIGFLVFYFSCSPTLFYSLDDKYRKKQTLQNELIQFERYSLMQTNSIYNISSCLKFDLQHIFISLSLDRIYSYHIPSGFHSNHSFNILIHSNNPFHHSNNPFHILIPKELREFHHINRQYHIRNRMNSQILIQKTTNEKTNTKIL